MIYFYKTNTVPEDVRGFRHLPEDPGGQVGIGHAFPATSRVYRRVASFFGPPNKVPLESASKCVRTDVSGSEGANCASFQPRKIQIDIISTEK